MCDGRLIAVDAIDLETTLGFRRRPLALLDGIGRPWWWKPNLAGLGRIVESAGFELEGPPRRLRMPPGAGHPPPPRPSLATLRAPQGREAMFVARWGDPHGIVTARPVS